MKLIVGLGNPGKHYALTRHNAGFLAVDYIARGLGLEFAEHKKTKSLLAKDAGIILLKPQAFMNLSGESVVAALNFFKLTKEDLLVIHDDLDIALGKLKMTASSRAAGNNGVQSIIDALGSQDFQRIRIGIKSEETASWPAEKFVLSKFEPEDLETIKELFPQIKKQALE
jgi:PTH1 family peptidyl-tRNA hydrolase